MKVHISLTFLLFHCLFFLFSQCFQGHPSQGHGGSGAHLKNIGHDVRIHSGWDAGPL